MFQPLRPKLAIFRPTRPTQKSSTVADPSMPRFNRLDRWKKVFDNLLPKRAKFDRLGPNWTCFDRLEQSKKVFDCDRPKRALFRPTRLKELIFDCVRPKHAMLRSTRRKMILFRPTRTMYKNT